MFLFFFFLSILKGYQWLKERVNSEEGRRQLAKIKELHLLADRLGCTAAQLAIGSTKANDTWAKITTQCLVGQVFYSLGVFLYNTDRIHRSCSTKRT